MNKNIRIAIVGIGVFLCACQFVLAFVAEQYILCIWVFGNFVLLLAWNTACHTCEKMMGYVDRVHDEVTKMGEIEVKDNQATLCRQVYRNGELILQLSQKDIEAHPDRYETWGTFK
jgi:hypothetical protein